MVIFGMRDSLLPGFTDQYNTLLYSAENEHQFTENRGIKAEVNRGRHPSQNTDHHAEKWDKL